MPYDKNESTHKIMRGTVPLKTGSLRENGATLPPEKGEEQSKIIGNKSRTS